MGVGGGWSVCAITELLGHLRIKTSPASQRRELFMGLLKGHMPKTSFDKKELRCGVQFFFKTQERIEHVDEQHFT